jgi:hypothetical protein
MADGFSPRIYTPEYYLTLGKFVSDFSEIEQAMQMALWVLAKVATPVAQAVFSGVRADDGANKITRIGVAEKWPESRMLEWEAICGRLTLLRTFRNDILHYGVRWQSENEWITTNREFAHTEDRITESPGTIAILETAIGDLQYLGLHLLRFAFNAQTPGGLTALKRTHDDAWRYRPPSQVPRGKRRNPDSALKRLRQRKPSSAERRKEASQKT